MTITFEDNDGSDWMWIRPDVTQTRDKRLFRNRWPKKVNANPIIGKLLENNNNNIEEDY